MRYKKTDWEFKNLGTSSCEITMERNDTIEKLMEMEKGILEEYRVLKMPTNMPDILFYIQSLGYVFIETQISLSLKKEDFSPISIKNACYEKIQWKEINSREDLEQLAFIKKGDTFVTDRIAIDPYFGRKKAGLRYFNWMQDICARGGSIVLTKVDGRIIGCSTMEMFPRGVCYLSLGGMMASADDEAYYACMDGVERYALEKLGVKRLETAVSSNNLPIIRVLEKKGYRVKGMNYVYVKHDKKIE